MVLPPLRLEPLRQIGRLAWLAPALALALAVGFLPVSSSAALVIGGSLAIAAFLRPAVGLGLLLVAVPFGEVVPGAQVAVGPLEAGPGVALVGLVSMGWLAGVLARRQHLEVGPLFWPITAFIGAVLLAASFAEQAPPALKELLRWTQLLLGYLVALSMLRTERSRRVVLGALLAAGLAEALVGIYQFSTGSGPAAYRLGSFVRAYGTFGQPNAFAGYLELVVPLALALVALWRPGRSDWLWWLALVSGAVGSAAMVTSLSRGGWLGLAFGIAVGAAVATRRGWLVVLGATALATLGYIADAVGLLPGTIAERLSQAVSYFRVFDTRGVVPTDANFALVERMAHWQAGLGMFLDHPLVGVGPGHYAIAFPQYEILPYWTDALGHAHNIYINVAAETGLIGLIAYVVMVGSWLVCAFASARRPASEGADGLSRAIVVGVLGCIVATSVHNVVDNLYVHMLHVQIGVLLGLMSACGGALAAARARQPVGRAQEASREGE